MSKFPMTVQGARALEEEVKHLKGVLRPQISQAIAEARELGDLKENAEYHAAREQQGMVEARIRDIEAKLSNALLGLSEEQATQWREQLQRLQEEITRQQTLEAERQAQLLQHRRQRPETDREALEDNLRQQRERLATSEQAYLDTYSQLQADNQRREQSQALLAELERARAEFRRWGRLNELIEIGRAHV